MSHEQRGVVQRDVQAASNDGPAARTLRRLFPSALPMCGSRQRVTAITEVGAATTATCKGRSTGDRQRRPLVQRGAAALAPAAVAYVSKRVHRAAHKHRRKGALREVGPPTPRPSLVARERHVAGDAERALKEAKAAAPVGAAPGGCGGAVDIDGRAAHRE